MNNKDLSLINIADLIRYEKKDNSFILKLIVPSDDDKEKEEHLDHINGLLIKIIFNEISNYSLIGNESDNYTLVESKIDKNHISLKYKGVSYLTNSKDLEISFNFNSYNIEEIKDIEGPDA